MKKIIILIFGLILLSSLVNAVEYTTVIQSLTFEGATILPGVNTDTYSWSQDTGGTPSGTTGPCNGGSCTYSGADDSFGYAFVEASNGGCNESGMIATLQTGNDINWSASNETTISFKNHMLGANIGNLTLQAEYSTDTWTDLWSQVGAVGDVWTVVSISSTTEGYGGLRFKYTCGGGFAGDAAIDSIFVRQYIETDYSEGLVFNMDMNENTIDNARGNNGTIEGSTIYYNSNFYGYLLNSTYFDGVSDAITVPDDAADPYDNMPEITISMVVNRTTDLNSRLIHMNGVWNILYSSGSPGEIRWRIYNANC